MFFIALIAAWLLRADKRLPRFTPYLVCLFFFGIGSIHATIDSRTPTDPLDIANLANERREVSLLGTMVRCPEINTEQTTILMASNRLIDQEGSTQTHGLVLLTTPSLPDNLAPGDLFVARATIGPVSSYGTPGVFNYHQYLADQGVRVKGWVKSPSLIMKVNRQSPPVLTERIRYLPEQLRFKISQFLTSSLPLQTASVYKAILLGDSSSITPQIEEAFKASGSIHLLSISGLHMALVALLSTGVLSWLFKRSEWALLHLPATKIAALLSLIPLTGYAMIAGANPPVVRSLLMISVFIAAMLLDRQWSIPTNIAIAALIILAVNPSQIFTASFQLSFSAISAIALFAPQVAYIAAPKVTKKDSLSAQQRILSTIKQWTIASFLISIAASLGTAPVLAFHFHRISLASPISTLLIEPILCLWSLIIGLIACLFIGIPPIAHALLSLGSPGITTSISIADLFTHFSWLYLWVAPPSIPSIIGWYAILIVIGSWRSLSRRALSLSVLACIVFWLVTALAKNNATTTNTTLSVLDVGQGSAMIIEVPGSDPILIDGGRKQSRPGKGFDTGENLIAPYLWHRGIKRLAMIVCSHPDADHYNGIPFILEQFKPKTLWINGYESTEVSYKQMLATATRLNIKILIPAPGMELYRAADISLTAITGGLSPSTPPNIASDNNRSLVLRLSHGDVSLLLPSDIEKEAEQSLLHHPGIKADVLIAPHHGSATSSSVDFLAAVAPRYIAISAGQNQHEYFPAPSVIDRYQKQNSIILNTATQGTLFFSTDGKDIRATTYR